MDRGYLKPGIFKLYQMDWLSTWVRLNLPSLVVILNELVELGLFVE